MKKILFVSSILFLFLLVSAEKTFACSCMASTKPLKTQVKEAFDNSAAVFTGEVIEIVSKGEFELTVKIKVEKSWKANLPKEIFLTTAKQSAMCGYGFEDGKKYIVYADGSVNALTANNCSRTTLESDKTDIKYLNKLKGLKNKKSQREKGR
jgi:hypothetical protein